MTDRIHPAAKPIPPPPMAAAAASTGTATATANGATSKPHLYPPGRPRPMYRPPPPRSRRCSCRKFCCLCFIYTLIFLLSLLLLAAIAACIFYLLYHPKHPTFSVSSLKISSFNLTSGADPATSYSHLTSRIDLTLSAKNPNKKLIYYYDNLLVSITSNTVPVGNATIPPFTHAPGNTTILRVAVSGDPNRDLDSDSVRSLRSDLEKKRAFPLKVEIDTKVEVKVGKLKSNRVGIRVSCDGIRGSAPKNSTSKKPTPGVISGAKCKVDLRIKIWKFTF